VLVAPRFSESGIEGRRVRLVHRQDRIGEVRTLCAGQVELELRLGEEHDPAVFEFFEAVFFDAGLLAGDRERVFPGPASAVLLPLLSTLDPARLETALTSSLLRGFRADRCALLGDEPTSDFRARIVKEAHTRGEALSIEGTCAALCAPLSPGSLILER